VAANARFARPGAVELSPRGLLYVLDAEAPRVRVINFGSKPVTAHGVRIGAGSIRTVAGNGIPGSSGDGTNAVTAQLGARSGNGGEGSLAVDAGGNLFIADNANHGVRQVGPAGIITTFAGQGAPAPRDQCCRDPVSVALDRAANLYVADLDVDEKGLTRPRVWVINRGPQPLTVLGQTVGPGEAKVVAGSGVQGLVADGTKAVASPLSIPTGMALDDRDNLYLVGLGDLEVDANSQNLGTTGEVTKVDAAGTITSLMGNGQAGFNGDGLKPELTSLNQPADVALDRCGNLLIADRGNDRVRRLNLAPCPPLQQEGDNSSLPRRYVNLAGWVLLALAASAAITAGLLRGRRRIAG
jgi:hypothetical protein